jgi:hypothetical protein
VTALRPGFFVGLSLLALGCDSDAEIKAEAGKVSHAVEVVRNADNAAKKPALDELRALPCSRPETCGVQSACVAAYELHLRGLDEIDQIQKRVAAGDAPGDLPAQLESARKGLERAKSLAQKCADAQGELGRRYHLR